MDRPAIESLLELAAGPAFTVRDGTICDANPKAAALDLTPGKLPPLPLPEMGAELPLLLSGQRWVLRCVETEGLSLCFLRQDKSRVLAPDENTLLHTAGKIRLNLQDMLTAMNALADTVEAEATTSRQAAMILRAVYRLRHTAENLELLAALCAGSFCLNRRSCRPVEVTGKLCSELDELLRQAGCTLHSELPRREHTSIIDWELTEVLLRELIAYAAARTADGQIRLSLTFLGKRRLCFAVRCRPAAFFLDNDAAELEENGGGGDELSLVRAGAEYHGGGLLLSREGNDVTALLTLDASDQCDRKIRSPVQLPQNPERNLIALSPVLPVEAFRPEGLL